MLTLPVIQFPTTSSIRVTVTGTATAQALPTLPGSYPLKWLLVQQIGIAATDYTILGKGGSTATALTANNGIAVLPGSQGIILNVKGCTHLHHIRGAGANTAIIITPIDG